MVERYLLILFFFFFSISISNSTNNIFIVAKVDGKIITNFDIKKEADYLKTLNPKLLNLEKKRIYDLSKNSLINEIIKKDELSKYVDLKENNEENTLMINQYLSDLYSKLNIKNEQDLKQLLKSKKTYSIEEVREKLKIEILWNQLIYARYGQLVKIDKKNLSKKIEKMKNKRIREFLLKEIVFNKKNNQSLDSLIEEINLSINKNGFDNTANIYSNSDSAKFGGNIGWVGENRLSEVVFKELDKIEKSNITNVIKVGNNRLILKIEDIRYKDILVNKDEELQKMIKFETNKQLNQYSRIYFDKTKVNYVINEE